MATAKKKPTEPKKVVKAKLPTAAQVRAAYAKAKPKRAAPKKKIVKLCAPIVVRVELPNGEWERVAEFKAFKEADAVKSAKHLAEWIAKKTNKSVSVAK